MALQTLNRAFNLQGRYILSGHSAGATLAFQQGLWGSSIPQPWAFLGVAGIYDFDAFVRAHESVPVYKEIMQNAFPSQDTWDEASPGVNASSQQLELWQGSQALIIAYSKEDELVDEAQAMLMLRSLQNRLGLQKKVHLMQVSGSHDEIWQNGQVLAGLLCDVLDMREV